MQVVLKLETKSSSHSALFAYPPSGMTGCGQEVSKCLALVLYLLWLILSRNYDQTAATYLPSLLWISWAEDYLHEQQTSITCTEAGCFGWHSPQEAGNPWKSVVGSADSSVQSRSSLISSPQESLPSPVENLRFICGSTETRVRGCDAVVVIQKTRRF